jgi:hypothetical protein
MRIGPCRAPMLLKRHGDKLRAADADGRTYGRVRNASGHEWVDWRFDCSVTDDIWISDAQWTRLCCTLRRVFAAARGFDPQVRAGQLCISAPVRASVTEYHVWILRGLSNLALARPLHQRSDRVAR